MGTLSTLIMTLAHSQILRLK